MAQRFSVSCPCRRFSNIYPVLVLYEGGQKTHLVRVTHFGIVIDIVSCLMRWGLAANAIMHWVQMVMIPQLGASARGLDDTDPHILQGCLFNIMQVEPDCLSQ